MLKFFRTIGGKLSISIAISIAAILISVSITAFLAIKSSNLGLKVYQVGLFEVEQALSIQSEFEAFRGLVARTPAEFDGKKQAAFKKAAVAKLSSIKSRLKEILSKGKSNKNLKEISEGINLASTSSEQVFKFSANFAQDQANAVLSGDFATAEKKLNSALKIFLQNAKNTASQGGSELVSLKGEIITYSLLSVVAGILVTLIAAGLLVRQLSLRLAKLNQTMSVLSKGDTEVAIPDTTAKDEIGTMARALDVFKSNAIEVVRIQNEREKQAKEAELKIEEDRANFARQTAVVEEVQAVAQSCAKGDFTKRVSTNGLDGFLLDLAEAINSINDVSEKGLSEIRNTMQAISEGDLNKTIIGDYEGLFEEIKQATNHTLSQLNRIMNDATEASSRVGQGDFSSVIDPSDRKGFMLKLANGINTINEVSDRGLSEIRTSVQAIAQGDLSKSIRGEYQGMFHEIKQAFNNTLQQLNAIISDATVVSSAAGKGDFSKQINTTGKDGFMLELAQGINSINEVSYNGLSEVKQVIAALSNGDVTQKVRGEYEGMFDEIKQALNMTIDQLANIAGQMRFAANDVSSSATEIANGTNDLSRRTEVQASKLQQTAAAMEEISATVQDNAANADQANLLAGNARNAATKGGTVVGNAVDAMSRIEKSSSKIADITTVIDEIAFQINLLALNAAVEAARAGEAGKGFEVVAAEVRKLAQRSANAAKDIEQLIEESGNEVTHGAKLVKETGDSLEEIVGSVTRLADIVGKISIANKDQSTGIEQINSSVSDMDSMTQQNTALVEQNSAAAQSLQQRSEEMQDRISFFKTTSQQEAVKSVKQPLRVIGG